MDIHNPDLHHHVLQTLGKVETILDKIVRWRNEQMLQVYITTKQQNTWITQWIFGLRPLSKCIISMYLFIILLPFLVIIVTIISVFNRDTAQMLTSYPKPELKIKTEECATRT